MKQLLLFSFFVLSILSWSCKKENQNEELDLGYAYFPKETGRYVIYQVDSISYNDFFTPVRIDTAHFQIKELIESHFTDNEGRECERIERFVRKNDSLPWVLRDVWYQTKTSARAEKVEENVRLVKLIFPITSTQKWNGNAYNTIGNYEYAYKNIDTKKTINGINFDSTITVNQQLDSNLIEKKYQLEIFAKNVGMVYKRFVDVQDKSSSIEPKPFPERIDAGTDYTYRIIAFGKQ